MKFSEIEQKRNTTLYGADINQDFSGNNDSDSEIEETCCKKFGKVLNTSAEATICLASLMLFISYLTGKFKNLKMPLNNALFAVFSIRYFKPTLNICKNLAKDKSIPSILGNIGNAGIFSAGTILLPLGLVKGLDSVKNALYTTLNIIFCTKYSEPTWNNIKKICKKILSRRNTESESTPLLGNNNHSKKEVNKSKGHVVLEGCTDATVFLTTLLLSYSNLTGNLKNNRDLLYNVVNAIFATKYAPHTYRAVKGLGKSISKGTCAAFRKVKSLFSRRVTDEQRQPPASVIHVNGNNLANYSDLNTIQHNTRITNHSKKVLEERNQSSQLRYSI